jgi:single-strand DNA-binding protein
MSTVNRVTLLGNVGTVEVKELQSGNKIVEVSLATSDGYKKNNEWVDKTEWHKCIFAIPGLAERASSISKGDKIYVEGSISTNSWTTKEGEKRERKDISCTMFKTFSKASQDKGSKPAGKPTRSIVDEMMDDGAPF